MITITDLVSICDDRYAVNLGWFEALGSWVADEPDPRRQRWFAVANHRHAWHADLWAKRRPAVPHDAEHRLPSPVAVTATADRAEAYATFLDEELARIAAIRTASDAELDPATHRLINLLEADLADLRNRMPR